MKINIAIDGPSAAGKSTIADILASKYNYCHLDTGAMYRAIGYKVLKNNLAIDDEEKIVAMMKETNLEMPRDGRVILDGEDISSKIRTNEISMAASNVSKLLGVRKMLVSMQQKIAEDKGYILDGRDIGTVVLKDAEVKVFMTASCEERAHRRFEQNKLLGIDSNYDEILEDVKKRDYQDSHRANSPLVKADDAIEINNSNMSIEEVVEEISKLVDEKIK